MLTLDLISDFDSFLGIEEEWNSLLEKTSTNSIFLRHEWFKCWWQAYGARKQLHILLIRKGGKLMGIGPLMISNDYFRGLPIKRIGFIENEETPRSNFIILHHRNQVIEKTISHLAQESSLWDVLAFNKIPMDTDAHGILQKICREKKIAFLVRPSLHSPYLPIDTKWDSFYKSTPQRFKKRLRYINNRLKKLGNISIEELTQPRNTEVALAEVFAIGQKSWKSGIRKSICSTRENRVFFSELTRTASTKGWLSLWLMRANDKPIAFEYHLKYKDKVHALRSEFNGQYAAYSPGSVLDSHIVKNIFLNGLKEYDMGGSTEPYKKYWTQCVREHCNILVFNKGFYPEVLQFLEGKVIASLKEIRPVILFLTIIKNFNR